jgi:hypothetical protein
MWLNYTKRLNRMVMEVLALAVLSNNNCCSKLKPLDSDKRWGNLSNNKNTGW